MTRSAANAHRPGCSAPRRSPSKTGRMGRAKGWPFLPGSEEGPALAGVCGRPPSLRCSLHKHHCTFLPGSPEGPGGHRLPRPASGSLVSPKVARHTMDQIHDHNEKFAVRVTDIINVYAKRKPKHNNPKAWVPDAVLRVCFGRGWRPHRHRLRGKGEEKLRCRNPSASSARGLLVMFLMQVRV